MAAQGMDERWDEGRSRAQNRKAAAAAQGQRRIFRKTFLPHKEAQQLRRDRGENKGWIETSMVAGHTKAVDKAVCFKMGIFQGSAYDPCSACRRR